MNEVCTILLSKDRTTIFKQVEFMLNIICQKVGLELYYVIRINCEDAIHRQSRISFPFYKMLFAKLPANRMSIIVWLFTGAYDTNSIFL